MLAVVPSTEEGMGLIREAEFVQTALFRIWVFNIRYLVTKELDIDHMTKSIRCVRVAAGGTDSQPIRISKHTNSLT